MTSSSELLSGARTAGVQGRPTDTRDAGGAPEREEEAGNRPHGETSLLIGPPRCFERGCRHLAGIDQPHHPEAKRRGDEDGQVWVCPAFPMGIPEDIAAGDNLHLEPDPRQAPGTEDVIYELEE